MRSEGTGGEGGADRGAGGKRRRWQALSVCLLAAFMTLLDISIVNVALPSIREGLHASEGELQWILSGYALMFGLVLVPAGRLGDARSRRAVFMFGLALFTLSSFLAGLAPGMLWLILARLLQGAAGGIINPQIIGLIQQLFTGAGRGRGFGALGTTIGLATAVGPLLGGVLIAVAGPDEGWRWIFHVNVPVGLAALPVAWLLLPAPVPAQRKRGESLDLAGVALLGVGVVAIMLPFLQERQWPGALKWLLIPAGAAVLTGWVAWERRHPSPLADVRLFRFRSYALGSAIGLLYFAGFTAIFFIFTLYLQNGLGYSPLGAGTAITPFALGSAVSAAVGGRLVARRGRRLVAAGLVMVTVGLAAAWLAVELHPGRGVAWFMAFPLLVAGVGSGFVIAPNQTVTLSEVPRGEGGSAGGVLQTGQRIGTAAGIAAVGAIFFAAVANSGGDWAAAFRHGLVVILAFVAAAMIAALADLAAGRRHHRAAASGAAGGSGGAATARSGRPRSPPRG